MKSKALCPSWIVTGILAALCSSAAVAPAATLTGKLVNGTTGQPGRADLVRVMDMDGGKDAVAELENVEGSFVFENLTPQERSPYLIQVQSDGVLYNERVAVPEGEDASIDIEIFDATDSLDDVRIAILHVIFQWDGQHMEVSELYEFANNSDPPLSVWQEPGPIRLDTPQDAHGEPSVSVAVGELPLSQEFRSTDEIGVSAVPYPLRPGSTRVVVRYNLEYDGSALSFAPTLHYPVDKLSAMVWPTDIRVTGPGLEPSEAPLDRFAAYSAPSLEAGGVFDVRLAGGTMTAPESDPHAGMEQTARIEVRDNRLNQARPWLLVGIVLAAMLGTLAAARSSSPADPAEGTPFLKALAKLEDGYVAGELDRASFEAKRHALLRGLSGDSRKSKSKQRRSPAKQS